MSQSKRMFIYVCVMLKIRKRASSNAVRHLIVFVGECLMRGRTGYVDQEIGI
jgi:hypothetical protein